MKVKKVAKLVMESDEASQFIQLAAILIKFSEIKDNTVNVNFNIPEELKGRVCSLIESLDNDYLYEIIEHKYDYVDIKLTDIQGKTVKDI